MNKNTNENKKYKAVNSLNEYFTSVSSQWHTIFNLTSELTRETLEALPSELSKEKLPIFSQNSGKLEDAIEALEDRIKHPELTLAMTGTTSSGKSTLVNMLVGADLMPSAVQELSAGIVQIEHNPTEHSLTIEETRGAKWPTGTSKNLTADEIRNRLEKTMRQFRKAEEANPEIEPVRFVVKWPTYMGKYPERFGLPGNIKLTLLDLPGLNAADDKRNGLVIQDNIKKALSLVIYNSAETDKVKQENLLRQVADQVQKLNASPDRMLFILNKIDVFSADNENRKQNTERFIDEMTNQFQKVISEKLSEYTKEAKKIKPIALSSRPALLAHIIEDKTCSKEEHTAAIKELDRQFNQVVPEEVWEDMPRKHENATDEELKVLANQYIEESGYRHFEEKLASHIQKNLSGLILKDVRADAESALGEILTSIRTILNEAESGNKEEVEKRREALQDIFKKIDAEQNNITSKLEELRKALKDEEKASGGLFSVTQKFERECGEKNLLAPLPLAKRGCLDDPYEKIVDFGEKILGDDIYKYSNGRDEFKHLYICDIFSYGDFDSNRQYYNSLVALRESPYVKEGGFFKDEDGSAASVIRALEEFSNTLTRVCQPIFKAVSTEHGKRIDNVLQRYLSKLIEMLQETLHAKYADDIKYFPSILDALSGMQIDIPKFESPNFNFLARWDKKSEESHMQEIKETNIMTYLTFGIYKKTVTKKIIDQHAGVEVKPFNEFVYDILKSSDAHQTLMISLYKYISEIIDCFSNEISKRFNMVKENYQQAQGDRLSQLESGLKENKEKIGKAKEIIADIDEQKIISFVVNGNDHA